MDYLIVFILDGLRDGLFFSGFSCGILCGIIFYRFFMRDSNTALQNIITQKDNDLTIFRQDIKDLKQELKEQKAFYEKELAKIAINNSAKEYKV